MPGDVLQVLRELERRPGTPGEVVAHRVEPAVAARTADLPPGLDPRLPRALAARGVASLYTHQRAAYDHVAAGRSVVVVTPTASGKTLCYNLPVLDALLKDPGARALYLFPTKALARDQAAALRELMEAAGSAPAGAPPAGAAPDAGEPSGAPDAPERLLEGLLAAAVYDGDTPPAERRIVRDRAHVVLSNPDMLHTAILPHHARWMRLFENLKIVVVDELHTYRGVFGSHLANVLRRLRRVCRFHGSDPVFVCASATIANAQAFAERLLERPMAVVDDNGAPLGERHLLLVNPPIVDAALGLRASYLQVTRRVAAAFLESGVPTIVFAGSRTVTEVLTKYLKDLWRPKVTGAPRIVGYRGGYLPRERREIERGLRDGSILGVVSTNALELGVDIGSLDASVLAGYPGTVASTRQQAGRAGRRQGASAAVLVLRSHPLDQYLADHPEYLLGASPEAAHLNADNLQILVSHVKCAAFELPLEDGEAFGGEDLPGILAYLEEHGTLRHAGGRWHWSKDAYPANDVSLRSVTSTNFVVVDDTADPPAVIAEVDYAWAFTTIHEGAIYMVQSEQYHVDRLDWERRKAYVRRVESEYYTDAMCYAKVKVLQVLREGAPPPAVAASYGEVEVVRRAVGYKKIKFYTQENLGWGAIALPEDLYHTQAAWFTVPCDVREALAVPVSDLVDALHGIAHLMHSLAALLLMCDARDLGSVIGDRAREWFSAPGLARAGGRAGPPPGAPAPLPPDPDAFEASVFLYDHYSGGIGLAEALQPRFPELLRGARERLGACPCSAGCPACVGPDREVGPRAKVTAARLLDLLLGRVSGGYRDLEAAAPAGLPAQAGADPVERAPASGAQ